MAVGYQRLVDVLDQLQSLGVSVLGEFDSEFADFLGQWPLKG
jgi:hypothetical protein